MAYRDNVEITEESYVPGGFGVEDYLIPNKPNIDWRDVGVSYAGGLSYAPDEFSVSRAFAGEQPQVDPDDVDLDDVQRKRTRRSGLSNTMMTVADLLKISASMPNVFGQSAIAPGSAYLGMTEEEANRRAKAHMEEDPEGKEIDINRAKVLSARAAATDDMDLKKKYGAAIKTLLPDETQGLDDITASDFFNSTDNKLKLEQLKGYNKLQQIALQNQGKMDVAGANNASRESIAAAKNTTNMQIKELDAQIKQAIADGKNDTALALQDKRSELQTMLHQMDNIADLQQESMRQEGAMNRTNAQQEGAYNRIVAQNAGALERVNAQQEGQNYRTDANNKAKIAVAMMKPVGGAGSGAGKGTAKERAENDMIQFRMENWDDYIKRQDDDLAAIQRAINILSENEGASGPYTNISMKYLGGKGTFSKTMDDYGELAAISRDVILRIIQDLNDAGATSSVFNSESEQERIIGTITDPSAPAKSRKKQFELFKQKLKNYYEKERKLTAWKASRMGMNIMPQQAQQAMASRVVSVSEVNGNRRRVDGGIEW